MPDAFLLILIPGANLAYGYRQNIADIDTKPVHPYGAFLFFMGIEQPQYDILAVGTGAADGALLYIDAGQELIFLINFAIII